MTARVDPDVILDAARRVPMDTVFLGPRRPYSRFPRIEHRFMLMGRPRRLQAILVEWKGKDGIVES